MLTAAQQRKCRSIAEGLDRGDLAAYKRAEDSLTPEMKGEVWSQRGHVRAAAQPQRQAAAVRPGRVELLADDLDFWSDDTAPDEPDDDEEQTTKLCPTCQGKGRDHSGKSCARCGGSGRLPLDDVDADEDDEDEIDEPEEE